MRIPNWPDTTPKGDLNRNARALCQVSAKSAYLLARKSAALSFHNTMETARDAFKADKSQKAEFRLAKKAAQAAFKLANRNANSAFKTAKDACKAVKPTPTPTLSVS